jgi:hypothetical protein
MAEQGERKTGMDYSPYKTPKSVALCLRVWTLGNTLTEERIAIRRKLLNRHGKLRK